MRGRMRKMPSFQEGVPGPVSGRRDEAEGSLSLSQSGTSGALSGRSEVRRIQGYTRWKRVYLMRVSNAYMRITFLNNRVVLRLLN